MKRFVKRVLMDNGHQTLVLQGVIHIAPAEFYQKLMDEMKKYHELGYTIFRENPLAGAEPKNPAEREVLYSVSELTPEIADYLAPMYGLANQRHLKYPEGTIDADMEGNEFLQKSAAIGVTTKDFFSSKMFQNWEILSSEQKRMRVQKYAYKQKKFPIILKLFLKGKIKKLFGLYLTERSQAAVNVILSTDFEKGYITYGNAHLKQIISGLQGRGWTIVSSEVHST